MTICGEKYYQKSGKVNDKSECILKISGHDKQTEKKLMGKKICKVNRLKCIENYINECDKKFNESTNFDLIEGTKHLVNSKF